MDWDWDDNPPRDTPPPRRAPEEAGPSADPRRSEPERREPEVTGAEATGAGAEQAEPLDESVTQVFSADAAWELTGEQSPLVSAPQSPPPEFVVPDRTETGRPAPSAEFERPRMSTIEASERAAVAGARGPATATSAGRARRRTARRGGNSAAASCAAAGSPPW